MIEYRIETESGIKKVLDIWRKFLEPVDDSTWHFTLEGSYIELRITKIPEFDELHILLDKYFKEKKWKYTTFEYKDAIPITRKYQKQYEKIFHGFSELSMKVNRIKNKEKREKELDDTIERCVHLVFNIMGKDCLSEAKWLARYAVGRAYTTGKWEKR